MSIAAREELVDGAHTQSPAPASRSEPAHDVRPATM